MVIAAAARFRARKRREESAETTFLLPVFDSLTESEVKIRKKPSRSTVGRKCTTGGPD
jgi:hypothetical protein